ncbi:unnamed protein product [Spirodela intermedia]|uniref:Protein DETOXIFICATION n=1 Tax=Spirodela intermedia TaxID=51605 RepID=A0A7I8JE53_SPIIN|nr:unnamed protein product [Spirodela intermedia]CAA6668428.1 unnamed protein product [Spirodela intermedia]
MEDGGADHGDELLGVPAGNGVGALPGPAGGPELAGGALSIGFTNITGYSVLFGLASGLEPLCSQAYGSKNWELISLSFQRTVVLLLAAAVPIAVLWLNLGPILGTLLRQDPAITAVAATYCAYSLPDLLTNAFLQPLRVYLRSQGITKPMMCCSAVAVLFHVPLNLVLVFVLGMGVPGVAISAVLTNLNMVLFLLGYLYFSGACELTWTGWSPASLSHLSPLLRLALPSCLGVCLEWWWYEIMTVLAGYLPSPPSPSAPLPSLSRPPASCTPSPWPSAPASPPGFAPPFAIAASSSSPSRASSSSSSARVSSSTWSTSSSSCFGWWFRWGTSWGREAGEGEGGGAGGPGLRGGDRGVNVIWTAALRTRWAALFTEDAAVVALAAAAMPVMGLCELGNCPQTTGCGVINLLSFYLVGTPVAVALAFFLGGGFAGLWYGLLTAQAACAVSVLTVVLLRTDWELEAARARKLTAVEMGAPPPSPAAGRRPRDFSTPG